MHIKNWPRASEVYFPLINPDIFAHNTTFTPNSMDPAVLVKLSLEADKQRWICDFTLQYEVHRAAPLGLVEDHNSAKLNNYLLSNCSNK